MKEVKDLPLSWEKDNLLEGSLLSTVAKKTTSEHKVPLPGEVLGEYILGEKIGQGSFGTVFEGWGKHSTKKVAIKVETYLDVKYSQLENEYLTYIQLEGRPGFPRAEEFGRWNGYCYLVMEHLGMSLEDMLAVRNRQFCAKTIFIVGKRMLDLIETLHTLGKVHRDIKPDNFLIGKDPRKLYLIDLGMCKEYIKHGQHIPYAIGKRLTGTPRYASANAHKGVELSRRDDLESIGYILLYLAKGKLPWQGLKESKREKSRIIGNMKRSMCLADIIKNFPGEAQIAEYFNYVSSLEFDAAPDYAYLRKLLDTALAENGLYDDGVFEWEYVFKGVSEEGHSESMYAKKKPNVFQRLKKKLSKYFM